MTVQPLNKARPDTVSREDLHYELLRRLVKEPSASQRALARHMGVSVGKINYCLRALIDRGWVKVNNFRRSDQKSTYAYLLTPSGFAAKLRIGKAFLTRKEQEFEALSAEIESLRDEVQLAETDTS